MDQSIRSGPLDSRVHQSVIRLLIDRGAAPSLRELSAALGVSESVAEAALRRLQDSHGLVLHPGRADVWIAHPFSCTPTLFWVERDGVGWWAPCIWCAFGVVTLVGEPARIHTRIGGESESVVIDVANGTVSPPGLVAHFPIPLARAWDNVHHFCGSTLVFRDAAGVPRWCDRHGYPRGDVQPLSTVYALGRCWYGRHLAEDWKKWTVDEARQIFSELGLTSPIWQLPKADGRF